VDTSAHVDQLDSRYFRENEFINSTAGVADAGKPVKLNDSGIIDATMVDSSLEDHGSLLGLEDNDHPHYLLVANIDDTPVDSETAQPISSNWAFDHIAASDPHAGYRLESVDHTHQSTGAEAGQLDHGLALTGLDGDDHPQYLLANGTRTMSGSLDMDSQDIDNAKDITCSGIELDGGGLVRFGGTTNAYPALKRNGTDLEVRLADNSDYTSLTVSGIQLTGQIYGPTPPTSTPAGTTQDIDWNNGCAQILDLESASGDVTVAFSNAQACATYILEVRQDSAVARDIVWPGTVLWEDSTAPVVSTTLDSVDTFIFYYNGTSFHGSVLQNLGAP